MNVLSRILASCIPDGTRVRIMRGPLRGALWIAGAADGAGKGLSVVFGRSETRHVQALIPHVTSSSVCFDIGANVGFYALIFARNARSVYAFEPNPRNIRYLHEILEVNHMTNVEVMPFAMSDVEGQVMFREHEHHGQGCLDKEGTIPVTTVTCDAFCNRSGVTPDVMKIDVEGAEMAVLKGAQHVIRSRGPTILLSTHSNALREECLDFLRSNGYSTVEPITGHPDGIAWDFLCR
jgi:FkbM family methyltransferase